MPERLAVPDRVPVMPQRLQVTPERQTERLPVMPARLPVPTTPTPLPQRLPAMPKRLPVPQRFPAVPERQGAPVVPSAVVPDRLPVPATPTPLPQRLPVMPERLAVPQRQNVQSRQPKSQDLELLALLRRPALTFLEEEEEGDRGNSIIITVTGEPRVNPRSSLSYITRLGCKIHNFHH